MPLKALVPWIFCFVRYLVLYYEIMLTTALIALLNSSMINTRRTDKISKIRTISETGNSSAAVIKKTATANAIRRAIS